MTYWRYVVKRENKANEYHSTLQTFKPYYNPQVPSSTTHMRQQAFSKTMGASFVTAKPRRDISIGKETVEDYDETA